MQSEINVTKFNIEWIQEYDFNRDHPIFYNKGDVVSIELSDIKVFIVKSGDCLDPNSEFTSDDDLDYQSIQSWANKPSFYAALYDGIYYGEDIYKSDSLREIMAYTKKYIEAKATI